jgi:hypothetical protein
LDSLELYYHSVARNVPLKSLRSWIESDAYLWAVFPHRFCFESIEPPPLTGILSEIALSELCWELSDLLGKARVHPSMYSKMASSRFSRVSQNPSWRMWGRRDPGNASSAWDLAGDELLRASLRSHADSLEEFYDRFLRPRGVPYETDSAVISALDRIRKLV